MAFRLQLPLVAQAVVPAPAVQVLVAAQAGEEARKIIRKAPKTDRTRPVTARPEGALCENPGGGNVRGTANKTNKVLLNFLLSVISSGVFLDNILLRKVLNIYYYTYNTLVCQVQLQILSTIHIGSF